MRIEAEIGVVVMDDVPDNAGPCVRTENLTRRETEVLNWLTKGKTNRDIADILGMSPRTVNKHLEHIYVKLGVETRTAAAAVAREFPALSFA